MKRLLKSYTTAQKLRLLDECNTHTIKQVSITHHIHLSMLYRWRAKRHTLITTHKHTRKNGSGRRPMHPTHEARLYASIIHQRHTLGIPLSWTDVQEEMKTLVPCFKASSGWIHGFKQRYKSLINTILPCVLLILIPLI